MRTPSHAWVVPWQVCFVVAALLGAYASGLGPRIWLIGAALIGGAVAYVKWQIKRGAPLFTLADIRRSTLMSASTFGVVAGVLSVSTSHAHAIERVTVGVGAVLITAFATGVLTLCGLSLGTGSEQPVTKILPDPAHPGRPRRPARSTKRRP